MGADKKLFEKANNDLKENNKNVNKIKEVEEVKKVEKVKEVKECTKEEQEAKDIIEKAKVIFSSTSTKDNDVSKEKKLDFNDPRPDLKEDHLLWQDVLMSACKLNKELFINLHGFRIAGTTLIFASKNLKPIYPKDWDEKTSNEKRKKYLIPHKDDINTIFKKIFNKHMKIKNGAKYEEEIPF